MQLNLARGRKLIDPFGFDDNEEKGLCSSTPRGDGNAATLAALSYPFLHEVYAAQPREGTET